MNEGGKGSKCHSCLLGQLLYVLIVLYKNMIFHRGFSGGRLSFRVDPIKSPQRISYFCRDAVFHQYRRLKYAIFTIQVLAASVAEWIIDPASRGGPLFEVTALALDFFVN